MSPWGVAAGGCKPAVKELPLKGTGEARCKPPRSQAWLRMHTVSKRRDEKPTGNGTPASIPCTMGQWLHPMVLVVPKDGRGWIFRITSLKDVRGQPEIPSDQPGYREERDWLQMSPHLSASAEYIVVNVGGPYVEGSSPPVKRMGVGGSIVVGARESRVHGEGSQGIDVRPTNNRRSPWESLVSLVKWAAPTNEKPMTADSTREVADPWRAGCGESRTSGSEGGARKHSAAVRLTPTLQYTSRTSAQFSVPFRHTRLTFPTESVRVGSPGEPTSDSGVVHRLPWTAACSEGCLSAPQEDTF
jgi:hypothetical protein